MKLSEKFSSKKIAFWAVLAILILGAPILLQSLGLVYPILIGCYIFMYIIAVSGLDICFGYSGQISMGHAGFYAIGAYGAGLLHNLLGMPAIWSVLIATAVATIVGAILAYPASKLVFHFLSLATVAFGEIIYQLISHSPNNITGNFLGFFTGNMSIFGIELNSNFRFYYFALACMIIFLLAKTMIVKSKYGRAFMAIRENTHAADGMGINVRRYKIIAFAISACFTAFSGGMYLFLTGYICPDTFTQKQSVLFITMLLFGGTASLGGPILGAVSVLLLTEALRSLQSYQMLIYGILMLLVIVAMPGGLYGTLKPALEKLGNKLKARKAGDIHA